MEQEGEKVELYVYDLSQGLARQLSVQLLGKGIDGIWHTAIGVYGKEYYFGSGIQNNPIGQSLHGSPVQVMQLGYTQIPQDIFEEYLQEIQPRYTQETYSLMCHNCNNFSEELSQFLLGTGIPEYILRLPEDVLSSPMGPMLRPMIENLDATLRQGRVPMRQQMVSPAMPNFSNIQLPSTTTFPQATSKGAGAGVRGVQPASSAQACSVNIADMPPNVSPMSVSSASATKSSDPNLEAKHLASSSDKSLSVQKAAPSTNNSFGSVHAQVQEEIIHEFTQIMASGSFRASEAAALAAQRVLQRHGMGVSSVPSF
jgi:hypothetical protein